MQRFEPTEVTENLRRDVAAKLSQLFAEVDRNLKPATPAESEEIFVEAMRSSRPGFRLRT